MIIINIDPGPSTLAPDEAARLHQQVAEDFRIGWRTALCGLSVMLSSMACSALHPWGLA